MASVLSLARVLQVYDVYDIFLCIYNPRRLIRHVRLSLGNRHVFKGSFYHVRSYVSNHRNHTAELLNWCSFDNLQNVFYYENINIGKISGQEI